MIKLSEIYIRDPFILEYNSCFYLYGTTDETAWEGKAKGFKCYKSVDLNMFEEIGYVFKNSDDFWANENFWAPEVHIYNGKFYMFASFYKKGKHRACQILCADKPEGPFIPIANPVTPSDWDCLDGTLFIEDGIPYIIYSREWLQVKDGEIYYQALSKDLSKTISEPKILFKASSAPWVVGKDGNFVTDGPFFHKLKSGKLLMIWSSYSINGYALGIAVSDSGKLKEKWRHVSEPLFDKNGGHGMIFKYKEKLFISIHSPNDPHMSERTQFIEVEEKEDSLIRC